MQALEAGLNVQCSIFNLQCSLWHHHGKNMIDWIMDTSKGNEAVWQSVNHTTINSYGIEAGFNIQSSARPKDACYQRDARMFNLQCHYSYIHQDKKQEEGIVSQYALEYLLHKLVVSAQFPIFRSAKGRLLPARPKDACYQRDARTGRKNVQSSMFNGQCSMFNVQSSMFNVLMLGVNFRWQDRVGSYTDFDGNVCDYAPYALVDTRLTWHQSSWKVYIEANNLFNTHYHDYGLVPQPGRWLIAGFSLRL
jgi:iron complex outermembrane receptor protein